MISEFNMKSALVISSALCLFAILPGSTQADLGDLMQSVDKANAFAAKHGLVSATTSCCVHPGDADHNGQATVGDVIFLINYVFMGGPPPPCPYEADITGDCRVNIADAVALIRPIFTFAPWPNCAPADCQY